MPVNITHTSSGDFTIGVDWDDNGSGQGLVVEKWGSSAAVELARIEPAELVMSAGSRIHSMGGALQLRRNSGSGVIADFTSGTTTVGEVGSDGRFSVGRVRLPVLSAAPTMSGSLGQMCLYSSGGVYRLYVNIDGGTTWKYLTLT